MNLQHHYREDLRTHDCSVCGYPRENTGYHPFEPAHQSCIQSYLQSEAFVTALRDADFKVTGRMVPEQVARAIATALRERT